MADTDWGAFTSETIWQVENCTWADGWEARQQKARTTARAWINPQGVPLFHLTRLGATATHSALRYLWQRRSRPNGDVAAAEFRRAAERLGPAWVKLAQIISAGDGVFPDQLVAECRTLRDKAPTLAFRQIENVLDAELGTTWRNQIVHIDTTPLAAASIAQTHTGVLTDGSRVVIKVQRPDVARQIAGDIRALAKVSPWLVGRINVAALANPPALVELFAHTIVEELDFRIEAQNMLDAARALHTWGQGKVVVPRPHPQLVTERVLVMERFDGYHIDNVTQLAEQLGVTKGRDVVISLLETMLEGALLAGVFHGDLHTGNMLVLPDGTVGLFDYGITARLAETERIAFAQLVAGGITGDWRQQLRALAELGAVPRDASLEELGHELGLDQPPIDPVAMDAQQLNAELERLSKALLSSGARLPKPLMLWAKDIAFLDAAIGSLAADENLIEIVTNAVSSFLTRHAAQLAALTGSDIGVDETAVKASLGIPLDRDEITWREMRDRRALIVERGRKAR